MLKKKLVIPAILATMIVAPIYSTANLAEKSVPPPAAGQTNSSHTPYAGQSYEQPENVLALYKEPEFDLVTPGLKNGKWMTNNPDMITYLQNIVNENSDIVTMEVAGQSLEGVDLPMLVFTKTSGKDSPEFKAKPTVWLQGHVHGNEPAGGESMLVMANELANGRLGDEVLDKINVVIYPRINPDGAQYFQRQTALRLDANRDHVKLELPETQALHNGMNQFKPEVVVDAHEYGMSNSTYKQFGKDGSIKYHDILLLAGKNLNIPSEIRKQSDDLFAANVFKSLTDKGYSNREYFTNSSKNGHVTLNEGGAEARIGRNANGLQPSFSFLVESRGIGIGKENFVRRVASQVETHSSILRTTANNAAQVKKMVADARDEITEKGKTYSEEDTVILQSKSTELKNQTLEIVDVATGTVNEIPVTYNSSTNGVATVERVRPTAYILPPAYHDIAKKLETQGATVNKTKNAQELVVESYVVTDKKVNTTYYEGHMLADVKAEVSKKNVHFPAGSYVISMAQPTANLVALSLEPESVDSYVAFNFIPVDVKDEVPVYRYLKELDLVLE
ncbi:peptidase [Sporosarcina sp. PTS2304]|uniref:M14 family metallopeptidase n=1 Tax=Sporosarcina sp. PTS2304 TaxID=2283194 RepID=UPI000E0D62D2|nr:M14 family metallocarboxypeptidase [Sporosarcina sp. PTS2304]AXH98329.1 peptidase [Sporosarcina sp. PTS2304]